MATMLKLPGLSFNQGVVESGGPEGDSTLNAFKDVYIWQGSPNSNNNGNGLICGLDSGGTVLATLIGFDFLAAGIPVGSTIDSVTLRLMRQTAVIGGPSEITFDRTTSAWTEGTVTWNTAPTTEGSTFSIARSGTSIDTYEDYTSAALTTSVQNAVNADGQWLYRLDAGGALIANQRVIWYDRESVFIPRRPQMIVAYTAPGGFAVVQTVAVNQINWPRFVTFEGNYTQEGIGAITLIGFIVSTFPGATLATYDVVLNDDVGLPEDPPPQSFFGGANGPFPISGAPELAPSTLYYVRAFIVLDDTDEFYGDDISFQTPGGGGGTYVVVDPTGGISTQYFRLVRPRGPRWRTNR